MRLIDADNLKAELFDANWLTDNDEHMVEKIVERQSTVDAEPVRHGRWIQGKIITAFHHCSICGATYKMQVSCNKYVLFCYCPHCGAKMDGDADSVNS